MHKSKFTLVQNNFSPEFSKTVIGSSRSSKNGEKQNKEMERSSRSSKTQWHIRWKWEKEMEMPYLGVDKKEGLLVATPCGEGFPTTAVFSRWRQRRQRQQLQQMGPTEERRNGNSSRKGGTTVAQEREEWWGRNDNRGSVSACVCFYIGRVNLVISPSLAIFPSCQNVTFLPRRRDWKVPHFHS